GAVPLPAPVRALLRLRATPAAVELPAHLSVGGSSRVEVADARLVAPSPTQVPLERLRAAGRQDAGLDLPEVGAALQAAVDATGRRVCPRVEHLANGDFTRWLALDSYRQVPEEWELTAGSVRFSSDERAAVLGDKTQRSALSQVVAVSGGCRYVLTVVARGVPDAAAELLWRGESCSGVRIDRLPLEPVPAATAARPPP